MLKAGDLIQHIKTGDVIEVVERLGNDRSYSVRVRMKQRGPNSTGVPSVYMAPDQTWLITEIGYWLQQRHYRQVTEADLKPDHQCENMKPKNTWPFVTRCRNMGARRRQVLVGKQAGTWDPIYEWHYVCDSCTQNIDTMPDPRG